jgi:hypothetical protein
MIIHDRESAEEYRRKRRVANAAALAENRPPDFGMNNISWRDGLAELHAQIAAGIPVPCQTSFRPREDRQ